MWDEIASHIHEKELEKERKKQEKEIKRERKKQEKAGKKGKGKRRGGRRAKDTDENVCQG